MGPEAWPPWGALGGWGHEARASRGKRGKGLDWLPCPSRDQLRLLAGPAPECLPDLIRLPRLFSAASSERGSENAEAARMTRVARGAAFLSTHRFFNPFPPKAKEGGGKAGPLPDSALPIPRGRIPSLTVLIIIIITSCDVII